jgi:succinoglycan biosynthesis transport protein ExoP
VLRTSDQSLEPAPLRTYVTVLARRKWLFMLVLLAGPVAAVLVSLLGELLYEARAQVLLSDRDLAGAISGTQAPPAVDPNRVVDTQARIARTPDLARRVLRSADVGSKTADEFLAASNVSPDRSTNVLEFSVVDPVPGTAERLATAYAQQFVLYTRAIETSAIERARRGVTAQMSRLARRGARDSPLYARLAEQAQTLRTMAALQTSRAQLLRRAERAVQVEPRPRRAGAFAFIATLLLVVGLIALLEALDTRVRSETDVADALGAPLLGRVSGPKRFRRNVGIAVLEEPDGPDAESFRILRANLEYANSKLAAQTIMVTSSVRGEGKSTMAANIAASFARLGRRVVLVDLDLRRTSVHRRFGLSGTFGVSDVALGRVALDEALVRVPIAAPSGNSSKGPFRHWAGGSSVADVGASSLAADSTAILEVLPAGAMPNDIGEFVAAGGVADLLRSLRERADIVFIDAPAVLEVSDPMTLMKHVDAIVAVARLGVVRHQMLKEFRRILDASSVSVLGVVITGADATTGYGPYHRYDYRAEQRAEAEQQAGLSAFRVVHARLNPRPPIS